MVNCSVSTVCYTQLEDCLNSSCHRLNKVSETSLKDFSLYGHDSITQLLLVVSSAAVAHLFCIQKKHSRRTDFIGADVFFFYNLCEQKSRTAAYGCVSVYKTLSQNLKDESPSKSSVYEAIRQV